MLRVLMRSLCILAVAMLLVSCSREYVDVRKKRVEEINKADSINIAIIWDKRTAKDFLLVEGSTMAADEINSQSGVLGRPVKLKFFYSENDTDELRLAKQIAKDTSLAAVIGHRSSTNAILASVTYEYCGLLYVSPSASNINLTNHNFEYTFRSIPSDHQASKGIAKLMMSQGHIKIAVIDDRTLYGKGVADDVTESLSDLGLNMVVRRFYTLGTTDYKPLCAELLRHDFDAIFLGAILPQAAYFISEARQMGLYQQVYGGHAMDSMALERIGGKAALGTVVATYYNPDRDSPVTKKFISNFEKRYRKPPDTRAALFYDSMNLIIEAMKLSKTAEPAVVASHLRYLTDFQGVTGNFSFNIQGDPVGKESYFKYLGHNGFAPLAAPVESHKDKSVTDGQALLKPIGSPRGEL